MHIQIEHQIPGRLRVRLPGRIPARDAVALEAYLLEQPEVEHCVIYERIGSVALCLTQAGDSEATERSITALLCNLSNETLVKYRPATEALSVLRPTGLFSKVVTMCATYVATHWLLPYPLRVIWTLGQVARFVIEGLRSLLRLKLDVPVLDATALVVCAIKRDFGTAGTAAFLISLSELIEEQTRRHSEQELIASLLDIPEKAWLRHRAFEGTRVDQQNSAQLLDVADLASMHRDIPLQGGEDILVDTAELREGDLIVVRTGSSLPVDGEVVAGEAWVNQSSLTGEAAAVLRETGDNVFAGTAIEDGELIICVKATSKRTRLRSVVELVQLSESNKSGIEQQMERLANRIVPLNLLFAAGVFAITRSLEKLSAALMVDYSCALRLTGSIAALAAMREAATAGFRAKGSRCFEAIAEADTIVFDKTGTLTQAAPAVEAIIALDGWDEVELLRLAACIEEHFPHPVARAVVNEATRRNISHRERHAEVKLIVAHGIATSLEGQRVIIGSEHFVFDDERVICPVGLLEEIHESYPVASPLFLAVDDELVGACLIHDPLKPCVAQTLNELRACGLKRIVMLMGDNEHTARSVAEEAGIKEFAADLLPEDKHRYVEQLKAEGARVIMVGDGVNDSPALSAADAGIAMGDGAAIAREVADITLASDDLASLVAARQLSVRLQSRTKASYQVSIALNTALLLAGTTGILAPSISSLLHNGSTVALCINGTRRYLP